MICDLASRQPRASARDLFAVVGLEYGLSAAGAHPAKSEDLSLSASVSFSTTRQNEINEIASAETMVIATVDNSSADANVLRIAGPEPATLDPALVSSAEQVRIVNQIFEGLVRLDETQTPQPALASGWNYSPDASVYTFTLREAYFGNGRRVIAGDVVTSIMRALSPTINGGNPADYASMLYDLQGAELYNSGLITVPVGVQALDSTTVRFDLVGTAPPGSFLKKMAMWIASVVPIEEVNAGGVDWWRDPAHSIGAGPFKLTEWSPGVRLSLERNLLYHAGLPALSGVTVSFADTNAALEAFRAGQLDVFEPTTAQVPVIQTDPILATQWITEVGACSFYLKMDSRVAPFNGSNGTALRQAFNYAIDRAALVSATIPGAAIPAKGLLPPSLYGYNPGLQGLDFSVISATQALTTSGYTGTPPLILVHRATRASQAANVQTQLYNNLGLNIPLSLTLQNLTQFTMTMSGWCADYSDPDNWLPLLLRTGQDFTGYSNSAFDTLVDQAAQTITESERIALYQQAEQLAISDAAIVPLWHSQSMLLKQPRVLGPILFDWKWGHSFDNVSLGPVAPPIEVAVSGLITGATNTSLVFTATVSPLTATTPITYIWQASGLLPVTHVGGLRDSVMFNWPWGANGAQTVTVTANNDAGAAASTVNIWLNSTPAFADPTLDICMNQEPSNLYMYDGGTLAQLTLLSAVYDGPIDRVNYSYQPVILTRLPSLENGDAITQTVTINPGDLIVNNAGNVVTLTVGEVIRPSDCRAATCAITYTGGLVNMDRMRVTQTLSPSLTWSDGQPLTAYDSVYSFNLDAHPDTPSDKTRVQHTASYTATSATQTVWTSLPGFTPSDFMTYFWRPLPEHAWGGYAPIDLPNAPVTRAPLGWGPFVIDQWVPGSHIIDNATLPELFLEFVGRFAQVAAIPGFKDAAARRAVAVAQRRWLVDEIPLEAEFSNQVDHLLDVRDADRIDVASGRPVRAIQRYLKSFRVFEQELAGSPTAEEIERAPEDRDRADAVILGNLRRESQFAREIGEVVFLRREQHVIQSQCNHFAEVRLQMSGVVVSHIRNASTHSCLL